MLSVAALVLISGYTNIEVNISRQSHTICTMMTRGNPCLNENKNYPCLNQNKNYPCLNQNKN